MPIVQMMAVLLTSIVIFDTINEVNQDDLSH